MTFSSEGHTEAKCDLIVLTPLKVHETDQTDEGALGHLHGLEYSVCICDVFPITCHKFIPWIRFFTLF